MTYLDISSVLFYYFNAPCILVKHSEFYGLRLVNKQRFDVKRLWLVQNTCAAETDAAMSPNALQNSRRSIFIHHFPRL